MGGGWSGGEGWNRLETKRKGKKRKEKKRKEKKRKEKIRLSGGRSSRFAALYHRT